MKKITVFVSLVLMLSMLLAACGGAEEGEQTPGVTTSVDLTAMPETAEPGITEPVVTDQATEVGGVTPTESGTEPAATEPMATEPAVTEAQPTTGTPSAVGTDVIPPTGGLDSGRLSVLRTYQVCSHDNQPVADVYDFVIDLDNMEVDYVIVDKGRFMESEETTVSLIAVPWDSMEVRSDNGDGLSESCENAFVLLVSQDVFDNAPMFSLNNIPDIGVQVDGWDAELVAYWESGGTDTTDTITPEAGAATPTAELATATPTPEAGQATSTPAAGQATATPGATAEATQPAEQGTRLVGVVRAREVIGIYLVGDDGQRVGTIRDVLVDITNGQILYVVVEIRLSSGETRLIAVPMQVLRWDPVVLSFGFTVDLATLEAAPSFEGNTIPDTQVSGWDTDLLAYWSDIIGEQ